MGLAACHAYSAGLLGYQVTYLYNNWVFTIQMLYFYQFRKLGINV